MSLPEVTYDFYSSPTTWRGPLPEDAFGAALADATGRVRDIIGFNVPSTDAEVLSYRRAVCASVDVVDSYGASSGSVPMGNVTVGSFSYGSATSDGATDACTRDVMRAARCQLVGTNLLCQVIA